MRQTPERPSRLIPAVLLATAAYTTTVAGALLATGALAAARTDAEYFLIPLQVAISPALLASGLSFSFAILLILVAHELGHYLTCRFYGVTATLPYVIPCPPPLSPFGTLGAVIRIKSLFSDTRQLFDVGVAGPVAGFVLAVPVLAVGLLNSTTSPPIADGAVVWQFGEPLLFKLGVAAFFTGSGGNIDLHPIGWAAWFGMLATSLNLLPIGQLDGGHIVYATFGPRAHRVISYSTLAMVAVLGVAFWYGYLLFGGLIFFLGFRHPRTAYDQAPLGWGRILLALLALAILILTFMPVPVEIITDVQSI